MALSFQPCMTPVPALARPVALPETSVCASRTVAPLAHLWDQDRPAPYYFPLFFLPFASLSVIVWVCDTGGPPRTDW
jgi:hypothetical protein